MWNYLLKENKHEVSNLTNIMEHHYWRCDWLTVIQLDQNQFRTFCPNGNRFFQTFSNNIIAHTKFGENPLMFTQVFIQKQKTDGRTTDGHMDDQHETIIPCHYCVAGYKNGNGTMCPTRSEKFRTSENSADNGRWPTSNWIPAINAHTKFGKNPLIFSQVIVQKENTDTSRADSSVKNWQNLPISNPKPDPHIINAHTKFGKNPLIFTRYHLETDIRQTVIWTTNMKP